MGGRPEYEVRDFSDGGAVSLLIMREVGRKKYFAQVVESKDGERFLVYVGGTYRGHDRDLDEAVQKAKNLLGEKNV